MRLPILSLGLILAIAMGCQDEKIASLEKQNQELKAAAEKDHGTADYDLQAKCSKDAKEWFNENWGGTKDATLLNFTNHYNKSMNKCFILVEYHYSIGEKPSWSNTMSVWDVYENAKYATFIQNHMTYFKPSFHMEENVVVCEMGNAKCKTVDEFNDLVRPYLSN